MSYGYQLDEVRQQYGNDIRNLAIIDGTEWLCVCGRRNVFENDLEVQPCSWCGRDRNFVLEKISTNDKNLIEAIKQATPGSSGDIRQKVKNYFKQELDFLRKDKKVLYLNLILRCCSVILAYLTIVWLFNSQSGPGSYVGAYFKTVLSAERPCMEVGCLNPASPHSYKIAGSNGTTTYWYCPLHAPESIRTHFLIGEEVKKIVPFLRIKPIPLLIGGFYFFVIFIFLRCAFVINKPLVDTGISDPALSSLVARMIFMTLCCLGIIIPTVIDNLF